MKNLSYFVLVFIFWVCYNGPQGYPPQPEPHGMNGPHPSQVKK